MYENTTFRVKMSKTRYYIELYIMKENKQKMNSVIIYQYIMNMNIQEFQRFFLLLTSFFVLKIQKKNTIDYIASSK